MIHLPTGVGHSAWRRSGMSGARATVVGGPVLLAAVALSACSGSSAHRASAPAASGTAAASSTAEGSYGSLPTFLPSATDRPDSMLTGSAERPAVTSQGDRVLARLGSGSVQVQVAGPIVPGEGLPKVTDATTCTWTVTFEHATRPVPIRLSDFVSVDEDGHPYRVHYVPGARRPPAVLSPGASTTFQLRVVMNTGEGVMRWQPGGRALAVWDFVVEND